MNVTVTVLERYDGSVVTFHGTDPDGWPVTVAVDIRMASAIARALEDGPAVVVVEPWQIVGVAPRPAA